MVKAANNDLTILNWPSVTNVYRSVGSSKLTRLTKDRIKFTVRIGQKVPHQFGTETQTHSYTHTTRANNAICLWW